MAEGEGEQAAEGVQEQPVEGAAGGEAESQAQGQETTQAAGAQASAKVYGEKEVSEIVSKRVNELNSKWNRFGKPEEVEARLTRLQALEQQLQGMSGARQQVPGQNAQPAETEQDKQVREYIERLYPDLNKLGNIQQAMGMVMQARSQEVTVRNEATLQEAATKAGYSQEQFQMINKLVADSIRGNPQDLAAYRQTGSFEIVKRHFEALHSGFDSMAKAKAAAYANEKAKTANLPPKMPAAGVAAPTSKTTKMTNEQRVAAAFERFQKGPAA